MMTVFHLSFLVCQRYVKQSAMVWKQATINVYSRDLNIILFMKNHELM